LGELCVAVGDVVNANDVVAIIETGRPGHARARSPTRVSKPTTTLPADAHPPDLLLADKAAISVKASTSGVIAAVLVEIDEPIVELMPMFELR
jgi:pyruvate/2-oxoglutarate dehydrogenase complex dihydrolipoamide acyltransferase (E2) component